MRTTRNLILIFILCFGAVLFSGCTLFKGRQILPTGTDIEKTCFGECLDFISKTPGAEKCLANLEISKECREFFEKNPVKDKECMAGKIVTIPDIIPPGTVIPGKEKQDQETAQFYEMKRKYENKKWRGTLKGEEVATNPVIGGYTKTYTARIDEMRMIFNGPYGDPALLHNGELLSSIEIGGKAILESAHISITCGELNVEISSFPFNLAGGVSFSDGTINFGAADPEAHKDFKVLYVTTCEPGQEPFYGDDEPLWHIFEPAYAAFKFEGDKIILTAVSSNLIGAKLFPEDPLGVLKGTNAKVNISGELVPF